MSGDCQSVGEVEKNKGGRPKKELGAARVVLNVWASVERHKRNGGVSHPSFWECVRSPDATEKRSNEHDEKYQRSGRMVVARYVVHADIVDCYRLVEETMRATACPDWYREALLRTWPRFGKFAGKMELDESQWNEYAKRAEVDVPVGRLRNGKVNDGIRRMMKEMETEFLTELQQKIGGRWGSE